MGTRPSRDQSFGWKAPGAAGAVTDGTTEAKVWELVLASLTRWEFVREKRRS